MKCSATWIKIKGKVVYMLLALTLSISEVSTQYDLFYMILTGVCDQINTHTNVKFQISPSTNKQKMWHRHSLSYVRTTIVYEKLYHLGRRLLEYRCMSFPLLR